MDIDIVCQHIMRYMLEDTRGSTGTCLANKFIHIHGQKNNFYQFIIFFPTNKMYGYYCLLQYLLYVCTYIHVVYNTSTLVRKLGLQLCTTGTRGSAAFVYTFCVPSTSTLYYLLPMLLLAVLMVLRLTAVPGLDIPGSVDGGRVEGGRSKKSKAFAFFNSC